MVIDHQDADELSPSHAPMMTAIKAASYPLAWRARARQPSVALNAAPAAAQARWAGPPFTRRRTARDARRATC